MSIKAHSEAAGIPRRRRVKDNMGLYKGQDRKLDCCVRPFRSARRDLPSGQGLSSRVHSPFRENTYLAPHGSTAPSSEPIQGVIALEYQTYIKDYLPNARRNYSFLAMNTRRSSQLLKCYTDAILRRHEIFTMRVLDVLIKFCKRRLISIKI